MHHKSIDISQTLVQIFNEISKPIGLHEPSMGQREQELVEECLKSNWVSYLGKFVNQFEENLIDYTGISYASLMVSGTAALHMALIVLDIKPEEEVLVPALTFVATANSVKYCSAVPHFVDSNESTLGLDPEKLDKYLSEITELKNGFCYNKYTKRKIHSLIVMHTFGHASDIDALLEVCRKYSIFLIEDTAESLGSFYKGKHTGNFGDISIFSFNGNKIITTGGGGVLMSNKKEYAEKAKFLSTTAKKPHAWEFDHSEVGYNYRMPNINAAIGCAQMEKLSTFLESKRNLADFYKKLFQDNKDYWFFQEPRHSKSNYWLNAIILNDELEPYRDEILNSVISEKIGIRPAWKLISDLEIYKDTPRMDLSQSIRLQRKIINLPSSVGLYEKITRGTI